ncbi:MAG: alkaline phosphatase PhoX [Gammaproteobacteria bacterium]
MYKPVIISVALLLVLGCSGSPAPTETSQAPLSWLQPLPDSGLRATVLLTVGDRIGEYQPPGRLDGLGAWRTDKDTLRVFANHELPATAGYPYQLANGTELRGSRISYFDLDLGSGQLRAAGLAFDSIRDREGKRVELATQVSEQPRRPTAGLNALCSAAGYKAGQYGFVDDLFLTNEEVSAREDHPHGGSVWALDIGERELWAVPDLGRGAWENVAAVSAPEGYVALLLGDDIQFGRAPLYLYIGRKQGNDFLGRNGLRDGQLHVWVADGGEQSPADWRGTGTARPGSFVPLAARLDSRAGAKGYDARGYRDDTTLREAAWKLGAFVFSRPEDLHVNPTDGLQVIFASTGQGKSVPDDDWGTLYRIDLSFNPRAEGLPAVSAVLSIVHDGDDLGDRGIRSPDNLTWARDGMVYVQEDKATKLASFGADTGIDASLWRIDPRQPYDYQRLAVIDRAVSLPPGSVDRKADDFGAWESSGIIDVADRLDLPPGQQAFLLSVQAHGLSKGPIGGRRELVEGGQLVLLTSK